jgi:multiple sugar transport system substrate-binding protein
MSMTMSITRRTLLGGLAAGALATQARAEDIRLRMYWWGAQERNRRTLEVGAKYHERNPNITMVGESASADYWQKLVTMMAGRNIPDVFQLEPNSLADFAKRGACTALDGYIPNTLKIAEFGNNLDLCKVNSKIYGVGLGLNSFAMVVDETMYQQAGVPIPNATTTWDEFAEMSVAVTKAIGKPNVWGAPNGARYHNGLNVWLEQRDKRLYTADGRLGFDANDAAEWFDYWDKLAKRGGCVPADVQAGDHLDIDSSPLGQHKAACGLQYSNQLVGYQSQSKNKLSLTTYPQTKGSSRSGHFYRPALIWSIAATSKYKEQAAEFISFFVTDPQAGAILGVERGVPMLPAIRAQIAPSLNPIEQATVDYVNALAGKVVAVPPVAPKGASEFDRNVMRPIADELAFGRITPSEAGKRVISQAEAIL